MIIIDGFRSINAKIGLFVLQLLRLDNRCTASWIVYVRLIELLLCLQGVKTPSLCLSVSLVARAHSIFWVISELLLSTLPVHEEGRRFLLFEVLLLPIATFTCNCNG